jgi:hypothetical protein
MKAMVGKWRTVGTRGQRQRKFESAVLDTQSWRAHVPMDDGRAVGPGVTVRVTRGGQMLHLHMQAADAREFARALTFAAETAEKEAP